MCRLFGTLLCSLLAFAILGSMLYFFFIFPASVRPPKFQVDSTSVRSFNVLSSHMTAAWNLDFSHHKVGSGYSFQNMSASIFLKNQPTPICSSTSFESCKKNNSWATCYRVQMIAPSVYVNSTLADAVGDEKLRNGTVTFTLQVRAHFLWSSKDYFKSKSADEVAQATLVLVRVVVTCRDLQVGYASSPLVGDLLNGPRPCHTKSHV